MVTTAGELRSRESVHRVYVRFVNATRRSVDVIWVNYEGLHHKYKTLDPSGHVDVDTYVTHPWVFRESLTHQRLLVNRGDFVYQPVFRPLVRFVVRITIPMYTLKELCIYKIRTKVPTSDHVLQLDIPRSLRQELMDTWQPA